MCIEKLLEFIVNVWKLCDNIRGIESNIVVHILGFLRVAKWDAMEEEVNGMKRRGMFLLAAVCLLVVSVNSVYAVTSESDNAVMDDAVMDDSVSNEKVVNEGGTETEPGIWVLNSFNGDTMGSDLEDYSLTEDSVSFTYQDKLFEFSLEKYEMKDNQVDGVEYFWGSDGDIYCYVVKYEDSVCIKISDNTESMAGQQKDTLNNFTVVVFNDKDGKIEEISDAFKKMEEQNTK